MSGDMTREEKIDVIRNFVPRLRMLVTDLTPEELTTQYNPPEWTIAQNVHHLVDSHTRSYQLFKMILTSDEKPTLWNYAQERYAELPDGKDADIRNSLIILQGLHDRWAKMLDHITDWDKAGHAPWVDKDLTLDSLVTTYRNHCEAHYKQIQAVLDKMPQD